MFLNIPECATDPFAQQLILRKRGTINNDLKNINGKLMFIRSTYLFYKIIQHIYKINQSYDYALVVDLLSHVLR